MPSIIKNVPKLIGNLLITNAVLFVLITIFTATSTALAGTQWSTADNQTRLMISIGVLGQVCINLRAFVDTTTARVAKGELPFVDLPNETPAPGTIEKTVTVASETKTTLTPP